MFTLEQACLRVEKLYNRIAHRSTEIDKLEAYYEGRQPLAYASNEWRKFHADRYRGFSDNWCGVVGNAPAERLRVEGFKLDSDSSVSSDIEASLWSDWLYNDMEMQSSQGFLGSIVAKRSYVLVWGDDEGEPVVTWEHPAFVEVEYDYENPRLTVAAVKVWRDDETEFATLFTRDQVWKFERPSKIVEDSRSWPEQKRQAMLAGTWELRDRGDAPNPQPNPLGQVPVVEFANRPTLRGVPLSDIEGTVAMQDAINLLWAYLFTAADFASFPARVVMGQEPPKIPILDNKGNKIGEKVVKIDDLANGRMLWLTGSDTNISQWDPAKLDVFTAVIEQAVGHIAAQTRTPPHYLVANKGLSNLSGDALTAAETGLAMKVKEQQLFFTSPVRKVFELMALVRGNREVALAARHGNVIWQDAENRSEAQLADALLKKSQMGYPFEWLLRKDGNSPSDIRTILAMRKREQEDALVQGLQAITSAGGRTPEEVPDEDAA
jgi:hypothetical protein